MMCYVYHEHHFDEYVKCGCHEYLLFLNQWVVTLTIYTGRNDH